MENETGYGGKSISVTAEQTGIAEDDPERPIGRKRAHAGGSTFFNQTNASPRTGLLSSAAQNDRAV
jgi:hypothetical protein